MKTELPIPDELWQQIPPAAQAAILALIQHYEQRLADLEARLKQNSTNSSKPPSSDPPTLKRSPPKPPSNNKAGGQHGHAKALMPLDLQMRCQRLLDVTSKSSIVPPQRRLLFSSVDVSLAGREGESLMSDDSSNADADYVRRFEQENRA